MQASLSCNIYASLYKCVRLCVCVHLLTCVCVCVFARAHAAAFIGRCVPRISRPSHPSWQPIFWLSRSQTTTPLFTVDVPLVPCPMSHNPLPLFQEPIFIFFFPLTYSSLPFAPNTPYCTSSSLANSIFSYYFSSGLLHFPSLLASPLPSFNLRLALTFHFIQMQIHIMLTT